MSRSRPTPGSAPGSGGGCVPCPPPVSAASPGEEPATRSPTTTGRLTPGRSPQVHPSRPWWHHTFYTEPQYVALHPLHRSGVHSRIYHIQCTVMYPSLPVHIHVYCPKTFPSLRYETRCPLVPSLPGRLQSPSVMRRRRRGYWLLGICGDRSWREV